jgi:hypothetical protein
MPAGEEKWHCRPPERITAGVQKFTEKPLKT